MSHPTVRIATYNIRSLRDDRSAVVRVIRGLRADVVCLQEAPRFLLSRRQCEWLARATALRIVVGGRLAAANLILAERDVAVHRTQNVLFTNDFRLHQRGTALADVTAAGVRLVVAGTHLDGVEQPRLRHIDELHRALDAFVPPSVPVVVGGDINDQPGSEAWRRLTSRGVDAGSIAHTGDRLTNDTRAPSRRIDALFVGAGLRVISTEAVDSRDVRIASDHRPVVAELTTE